MDRYQFVGHMKSEENVKKIWSCYYLFFTSEHEAGLQREFQLENGLLKGFKRVSLIFLFFKVYPSVDTNKSGIPPIHLDHSKPLLNRLHVHFECPWWTLLFVSGPVRLWVEFLDWVGQEVFAVDSDWSWRDIATDQHLLSQGRKQLLQNC